VSRETLLICPIVSAIRATEVKEELEGVLGFILTTVRERRDDG
jgi:hypothetical protein